MTPTERRPRPLSGDEIADCEEQFDTCDEDGDQRVGFAEFAQLLENLGSQIPPAQRRGQFEAIDTNHDGAIDRGEFLQWWRGA